MRRYLKTYHLLADMIHNCHNRILIPPVWILNALDFTPHDNNLTSRNKLSSTICRSQMWWNTRWCNVAIESLGKTINHLCPLASRQGSGWAGSEDKVAVQVNNKRVIWCCEECPAYCCDTQNVWTGFLG